MPLLAAGIAAYAGDTSGSNGAAFGLALAGGILAAAGVLLTGMRLHRTERSLAGQRAARAHLQSFVQALPDAWCGWGPGGMQTMSDGFCPLLDLERCERPEQIEAALVPSDAAALHGAFARLRSSGHGFQMPVTSADGKRTLQITGRRAPPPELLPGTSPDMVFDLLWLRDVTPLAAEAERQARLRSAADETVRELRTALDVVPYPIWLRREDLSLAWVNKAYAKVLDTSAHSITQSQRELTSEVAGASGRALAEQARSSGIAQSESVHLVADGQRRLFEVIEAPLPAPGGTPAPVVGYALDRTTHEELNAEFARHVSAHAEVLEQLGSAIAIFGADTRLKFYNHAYVQLWGFEETWLDSEPSYAEVLEDLRARRRLPEYADFVGFKKSQLTLFTSLIEPREDLEHLPDGTTLRRLVVPHPFGGLMFILEDVTNALALESSYNTLMAVQQETLDNLAEGIAVFGGDGRLKLSNPAYARIWHLSRSDLAGEPHVVELIEKMKTFFDYGDDWIGFKDEMIGNTLDRTARSGRIERTDGSVIEFANVPLPDGAVLNSFLDVTDTSRVEQALRERNAALETADRLKAEFIANVSYQLRTPLNAIMGFSEILVNEYFGTLNERQAEYCRAVLDSGNRLLLLINDILDLATVEAGFMSLDRAPVDVPHLLHGIADLTRDWALKQDLRIEVDCDEGLGAIDADERRLKQALFNLISNSIKFTPPGGRIIVSGRRQDDWIVLTVEDTGIGIPQADQNRVFERFERTNAHTRQVGVGLGLSLVKSLVELHGGRIEIDSRVNEGTLIRCLLPARPASLAVAGRTGTC
ncbi:MAG TPA: ATP-binding protein [Arenibaculum sp.]|nr:ATP-binding protein [Arenibaculum sp.]